MVEHALGYALRGWRVFPCKINKSPYTSNGFHAATCDEVQIKEWWSKWPEASIGFAVPEDIVVIDVDIKHHEGKYGDESLAEFERDHGVLPNTVLSLTGGGGLQYFFTTDKPVKCMTNILPAIDVKSAGGYVILPPSTHPSGKRYAWEVNCNPADIPLSPLPKAFYELMTAAKAQAPKELPERISDGMRNDTLFRLACSLRTKGLTEEEISAAVFRANQDRCVPPLPEREVEAIVHSAAQYERGADDMTFVSDTGRILHNVMGDYLVKEFNVCKINDALHIYSNGIYKQGEEILHGHMIQLVPGITDAKRREVYKYIKASLMTPVKEVSPPYLIPFKSQIYDLHADRFLDYSPEYVFLNRFPYDYIPDTSPQRIITDMIEQIADGDTEVTALIYEAIGNCFYLLNSYRGAVMLYGRNGNNGKSTLLNMIRQLLGKDNTSSLSLQDTAERFRLVEIYGKAANIGDDIPDAYLPDSAVFKKLVTGEYVTAERKGQDAFAFKSFAKLFFAMNKLPSVSDKSNAFYGRLLLIPLNRDFSQAPDVGLKDRVWTQSEMEYLTVLAMDGLKRLFMHGNFTRPKVVTDALRKYEKENNPVLEFIEEYDQIEDEPVSEVYSGFRSWCMENGHKNIFTRRKFTEEMIIATGFKSEAIRHPRYPQRTTRCFVKEY